MVPFMGSDGLTLAKDYCFVAGVNDLAAQLCATNAAFGLAKIHHIQRELGLENRACFIGAPDATVTRNPRRWRYGFGYGGLLALNPEIAVLDAKPNGCGMLVGALTAPPDVNLVRRKAEEARRDPPILEGVQLGYDLHESNHFVDVCTLESTFTDDAALPQEIFIIHSSGHEHRAQSPLGPGLYLDESAELQAMATRYKTPWGELSLLLGENAGAYYRFCSDVQAFNHRRRELFAERLFGTFDVVRNATHQGFRAPGLFYLGAYFFEDRDTGLFPLTLGPDQPVYLIRPHRNFNEAALQQLGWTERARRLDLGQRLHQANILPHGGGYALEGALKGVSSEDGDRHRYHIIRSDGSESSFVEVRDMPFAYRDDVVLRRLVELELGQPVARYRIRFIVK
ncbi:MAG: hypothetical protein JRH20_01880 [Deltaproteobacteria bacterium]|nr:hypothetical protein [Deltaproteobacteria bacterium]